MKLSAVIPVHGSAYASRTHFLREIIKSSAQVKLVIVADGLSQADASALEEIVKENDFIGIDLIHGIFGDPGSARNAGLEIVDTNWVCFWDSDDIPNPVTFKSMIDMAELADAKVAKGCYEVLDVKSGKRNLVSTQHVSIQNSARHLLDPGIWRYAFSKEIYKKIRFPALRMGEDQDYLVKVLLEKRKIFQTKDLVYTYRVGHDTQITKSGTAFLDVSQSLKLLEDLLIEKRNDHDAYLIILTSYIKQLISGVKRVGIKKTGIDAIIVVKILARAFFRIKLFQYVQILFSREKRIN